jgi:hypothetical protein
VTEEQEPTIPLTKEQELWAAAHKEDPAEVIRQGEAELRERGITITSRTIDAPPNPGRFIRESIELAEAAGATVNRNPIPSSGSFMDMPEGHHCHCALCYATVAPSRAPESKHHYSVEFGDWVLRVAKMLDGAWVAIEDVLEVNVDADWAIRVSVPVHTCANCWRGTCLYRDKGEFGVQLEVKRA